MSQLYPNALFISCNSDNEVGKKISHVPLTRGGNWGSKNSLPQCTQTWWRSCLQAAGGDSPGHLVTGLWFTFRVDGTHPSEAEHRGNFTFWALNIIVRPDYVVSIKWLECALIGLVYKFNWNISSIWTVYCVTHLLKIDKYSFCGKESLWFTELPICGTEQSIPMAKKHWKCCKPN